MPHVVNPTSISTLIAELIGWKLCLSCRGLCNYETAEYSEHYQDLACPHCHAILRIDVVDGASEFLPPEPLRIAPSCPGVERAEPSGGSAAHVCRCEDLRSTFADGVYNPEWQEEERSRAGHYPGCPCHPSR